MYSEFSCEEPLGIHPQAVLPVQYCGPRRRHAPDKGGEYRLLAALLEDAVACFQQHAFATDRRSQRLFLEAEQWLLGHGGWPPLSFEYVCAVLGLDAECLRQGLRRWRQGVRTGDLGKGPSET